MWQEDRRSASVGSGTTPRVPSLRWLAAVAVAVALVAAVSVVLAGQGATRSRNHTAAATATVQVARQATASPTLAGGPQWVTAPTAGVLAPSDPQVSYVAGVLASATKFGPATSVFKRTDDGGATWHDLALPVQNLDLNNTQFSIMVSPVDPHFVILTIVIFQAASCPPPGQASIAGSPIASSGRPGSGVVRLSSNTYASSGPPCTLQYDSADGGDHWARLALPITGTLGTAPYGYQFSEQALRAQGARLYAMNYAESSLIYGASSSTAPTGRLITSADGGATWRLADDGLPSDVGIGDYTPAPMGQAIFVVTDRSDAFSQSAASLSPPDLKLWRSDDAGGHWSLVGSLPFQVITGIRVVPVAGNAQPLIYLGTGGKGSSAPTGLQVSTDGGHTWAAAPAQPTQQVGAAPPVLWGVLADGSALVSFTLAQSGASGSTTLYAWKPGDVAWRQLAPPLSTTLITSLLVVPTGSGSGARIWVEESLPNSTATVYFDVS